MIFDKDCILTANRGPCIDDTRAERIHVSGKAETWRLTRQYLKRGYTVAFSNALILAMHGDDK